MMIVIDVDDVLSDTFGAFEDRFGIAADPTIENLDTMFPGVDVSSVLESVQFHLDIPPITDAAAGVNWLLDKGQDAIYLSSRPPAMEEVTEEWLLKHGFPNLPLQCLGRASKKHALRNNQYDMLIDDQIRYLEIAQTRKKSSIAFANPWNSSWMGIRVDGWNGFKDFFQNQFG